MAYGRNGGIFQVRQNPREYFLIHFSFHVSQLLVLNNSLVG